MFKKIVLIMNMNRRIERENLNGRFNAQVFEFKKVMIRVHHRNWLTLPEL